MATSYASSISRAGMSSGKLVVALMIFIAASLALVTVWHHWSKGYASISYWGAANGENIRYAPMVELIADGETFDISDARGLVHFRQALIEDASFSGTANVEQAQPNWTHEVTFSWPQKNDSTVVQFDLENGLLKLSGKPNGLVAKPDPTLSGLATFFADVTARVSE